MTSVSTFRQTTLACTDDSPRVLVTVHFNGDLPTLFGYWWMN